MNDRESSKDFAFHALSEAMNMGGGIMGKAFMHLLNIGKLTDNPNIIVFSTAFSPETVTLSERTKAIKQLYDNNHLDFVTQ